MFGAVYSPLYEGFLWKIFQNDNLPCWLTLLIFVLLEEMEKLLYLFEQSSYVVFMGKEYQVYKDKAGKFRFRLKAENNKIVAVSEAYENKVGVLNGVESVQKNCVVAIEDITAEGPRIPNPKYQIFYDKACGYRFHLMAPNGEIIATSEGYETKAGSLNGVEAVKSSCDAGIVDLEIGRSVKPEPTPMEVATPPPPPIAVKTEPKPMEKVIPPPLGCTDAKLEFNKIPDVVAKGDIVWFEGKLIRADNGKGIRARIDIDEQDRSFFNDQILTHGYSKEDGSFKIDWIAEGIDWWDDTAEVYAEFRGDNQARRVRTAIQKMRVK